MIDYNEPDTPRYEFEDEDGHRVTMGVVSVGPYGLSLSVGTTGPWVEVPEDQIEGMRHFLGEVSTLIRTRKENEGTQ